MNNLASPFEYLTSNSLTSTVKEFPAAPDSGAVSTLLYSLRSVDMSPVYLKLHEFLDYPEDWDGQDGQPLSSETFQRVCDYLTKKCPQKFPPDVDLNNDGSVTLSWDRGNRLVWSVEINEHKCVETSIDRDHGTSITTVV